MSAPDPLENPYYYLENFHTVLDWVETRYADLLGEDERGFIAGFRALPQPSRALLVRLIMRKGEVFRESKLDYAEIGHTAGAAAPLLALGWLDGAPEVGLDELFRLFLKAELEAMFPQRAAAGRKAEQLALLAADPALAAPRTLRGWHAASEERLLRVTVTALCERVRLLFFGNLRQDWTQFILSHLGIYQYEQVAFPPDARAFQSMRDVDGYIALQRCRDAFEAGVELDEVMAAMPAPYANDWLAGRRARLLFAIAQQYERCGWREQALAIYQDCAYPEARTRAVRVLEVLKRHAEALQLAEAAAGAPHNDAEAQQLARMLPRLRRKTGAAAPAARAARPVPREDLLLPHPGALHVEEAVRLHLQAGDPRSRVFYVENALANSLFGLLCWEAVFASVRGAFFHPFHTGPADLHDPDFYRRRKDRFDALLARCDSGEHAQTIRANYAAKAGLASPFVWWGALEPEVLDLALDCIPPAHLRKWCERMLADLRGHRNGFPDLIQFWPAADGEPARYRMVEVKGPGDRLQDNQLRWLEFCARHDMPVLVAYVQWEQS